MQVENVTTPGSAAVHQHGAEGSLALVVIWSKAREHDRVIEDLLRGEFEVLGRYENVWSENYVARNFERLYCDRRWPGRGHIIQKGAGPFRMIVIRDPSPAFGWRETTQGGALVNVNFFDTKAQVRRLLRKKRSVHVSDHLYEGRRDIALMLGTAILESVSRQSFKPSDGVPVTEIRRDTTGLHGWQSLDELFAVLREAVGFVLLNDPEEIVNGVQRADRPIELLTDDYLTAVRALNASPVLRDVPDVGGRFSIQLAGNGFPLAIRTTNDSFLPARLAAKALMTRNPSVHNSYRVPTDLQLLITAYRAVILSESIRPEQLAELDLLAQRLSRENTLRFLDESDVRDFVLRSVAEFVELRAPVPANPFVFFNFGAAGYRFPTLRSNVRGLRRTLFRVSIALDVGAREAKQALFERWPLVKLLVRKLRTGRRDSRQLKGGRASVPK